MPLSKRISLVAATLLTSGLMWAQPDVKPPAFRLPTTAEPVRYKVNMTVAPDKDTLTGSVDIDLTLKEATSVLWLNADKLNVKDATLTAGGRTFAAKIISQPKDLVGLAFDSPPPAGAGKLHVDYEGQVSRKDMAGVFQVKEGDHWYIYSQFENISARRAFPCFDEPGYKVPWQVTLTVPAGDKAFSNTPQISEKPADAGMKTVVFAETKPLPSYLVAIAVGPMDVVEAGKTGAKKTPVRIIVPQGHSAEAQYAGKAAVDIINLEEKYFGIPYPYEKLDEVAIPFAGYAMEHPGLVTYGASFFLMKPDAPLRTKQVGTSVMAHELAHQWFGDLVTTAWWDDIWLNEGFASWMANKIMIQYHPEWKMNIDELNAYQRAMDTDALVSSRKVRQEILSDDDIDNAFDGITYNKGSSLLNMFESYLGPAKFQQGIQEYLKKYSWKNATSAEFLEEMSGKNPAVAKAFSTFLDQAGVPLVAAKLQCSAKPAKLELTQERFLPHGSQGKSNQLWEIPVCVKYSAGAAEGRECTLLTKQTQTMTLSKTSSCPSWVEANADGAGYYRVLYEKPVLTALSENEGSLTLAERVSFIGDVSALTNGEIPLGEALALAPKLAHDPDPLVVDKTLQITSNLDNYLSRDELRAGYRRYLSDLYKSKAESLGWKDRTDDDAPTRVLRPELFELMANHAEDQEFIDQAKKLAAAWLEDHKAVDRDMLRAVMRAAAAHGDRALFDQMHEQAKKASDEETQGALIGAMNQFRDPEIVRSAFQLMLTDEFDIHQVVFSLLGRLPDANRDVAYDFVKQNWDALTAKLPSDYGAFMPFVAAGYCDPQHRADAQAFFDGRSTKFSGGPRNLAQSLERIDLCIANRTTNEPSVAAFFGKYETHAQLVH